MAERMVKESAFDMAIEAWSDRIDKDEIIKSKLRNEIAELEGKNERLEKEVEKLKQLNEHHAIWKDIYFEQWQDKDGRSCGVKDCAECSR